MHNSRVLKLRCFYYYYNVFIAISLFIVEGGFLSCPGVRSFYDTVNVAMSNVASVVLFIIYVCSPLYVGRYLVIFLLASSCVII